MSDYGFESDDWEPLLPSVPDELYPRYVPDEAEEEDDDGEEC